MKILMIKWHRRMALGAFAAVMIWGLSGLLHPLMTWTNPRPVTFMPPPVQNFTLPEAAVMARLVAAHAAEGFTGLRLMGEVVQITLPGQAERVYVALKGARAGQRVENGDRDHAVLVARHYTGLRTAPVVEAALVTRFSNQYTYINRYLPVWKITFGDARGISVYVDTATDRLGAITDRRKVILQSLFQILHTGQWLEAAEPLRVVLIAALVGLALSMSVAGLYMLVRLRGPRQGLRKVHRMLAYGALLPLLMFPVSGLFHLVVQSPLLYQEPAPAAPVFTAADFARWPRGVAADARLVPPGWWRVQDKTRVTYTRLADGARVEGDEAFVRALLKVKDEPVSLVSGFNDEYGFAYKRLPVWRVARGGEVLFIEAKTGVEAARVDVVKQAETWVFSRLHKWQFLDGLSARISGPGPFKTAFRDVVMVLFVALALGLAVIGLRIRPKKLTKGS